MDNLTAFEKYILSLELSDAVLYVIHCMKNGPSDSQAWELMAEHNGPNWSVPPDEMQKLIAKTILALEIKSMNLSNDAG